MIDEINMDMSLTKTGFCHNNVIELLKLFFEEIIFEKGKVSFDIVVE